MEGSVRLSPRQTEKEKVKDALVQACFECGPIQAERAYRAYASMFPEGDILMIEEVMNEPRPPAGRTCLHASAEKGNMDMCKWIIEHGGDCGRKDKAGYSPIHYAAVRGHVDILELLCTARSNVLLDRQTKNGDTALHLAVAYNKLEAVEYLAELGAYINPTNKALWTPLHTAAAAGNSTMVTLLLKAGAGPEAVNSVGNTALHEACKFQHIPVIKRLLDAHMDPMMKNDVGSTPLHIAAEFNLHTVVKCLLERGFKADEKNMLGQVPADLTTSTAVRLALSMVKGIRTVRRRASTGSVVAASLPSFLPQLNVPASKGGAQTQPMNMAKSITADRIHKTEGRRGRISGSQDTEKFAHLKSRDNGMWLSATLNVPAPAPAPQPDATFMKMTRRERRLSLGGANPGRLQAIPSADQPILNIAHMSETQQPVEMQSLAQTGQHTKAGNSLQQRNLFTMPTQDMDELTKYRAKQEIKDELNKKKMAKSQTYISRPTPTVPSTLK